MMPNILWGTRVLDLILLFLPGYVPGYPQSKYPNVKGMSVVGYDTRILWCTRVPALIFAGPTRVDTHVPPE